jgi:type II secretory pathway pseudopilin PulG
MKRKFVISLLALALAPTIALAQSQSGVSRAEVRAELTQLEQTGYRADTEASYPVQLQAAEQRVAAQQATANGTSGVGGSAPVATQSGVRPERPANGNGNAPGARDENGLLPLYFGS